MSSDRVIHNEYIAYAKANFALDWTGIHGIPHWARVKRFGLTVGKAVGADLQVVEAFAFLHDLFRHNDGYDPEHGLRASLMADELNQRFFHLEGTQVQILKEACRIHSEGTRPEDPTLAACLDGDRLDLYRVGMVPDARRLCTEVAGHPEVIEWAMAVTMGLESPQPAILQKTLG